MSKNLLKIPAFGNSMYPFFHSGDILFVKPISLTKLHINDFITFQMKQVVVTHRVIYIPKNRKYVIAKGDTNTYHDGKIKQRQIIGKVIEIERQKKRYTPDTLYQFQSFLYNQEIKKINTLFQKQKIEFVFLKGLPLHLYYEKDIPKRLYADCDILIDKTQQKKMHSLLLKIGYVTHDDTLSKFHKLLKDKENAINYVKKLHGISITFDIHLEASFMMHQLGSLDALYPQKLLDKFTKELLEQKRIISIDRTNYPILSPTHIILYLALHLFHHNFQGYYRYEFLNIILKKEKLMLDEMKKYTKTYKLTHFIAPVFLLLWKYYDSLKAKQIITTLAIPRHKMSSLQKHIKRVDIFCDDTRLEGGIKRFSLLFHYSQENLFKKLRVFISLSVLYSVFWVVVKKLRYYQIYTKYQFKKLY